MKDTVTSPNVSSVFRGMYNNVYSTALFLVPQRSDGQDFSPIEDFTTETLKSGPSPLTNHIKACNRQSNRCEYMWMLIWRLKQAWEIQASSMITSSPVRDRIVGLVEERRIANALEL